MGHHPAIDGGTRRRKLAAWPALGLPLYLLAGVGLAHLVAPEALSPAGLSFFGALGAIGLWRYGWAAIHLGRAIWYLRVRFPALRSTAQRHAGPPPALFILVTAYRQDPALIVRMFDSVVVEAKASGAATTMIAAVTDAAERALLDALLRRLDPPPGFQLVLMEQDGTGKRSALAEGLRAVARRAPDGEALLILMDGDTLLPPGCLGRIFPFFSADPSLAAVTTDACADMQGTAWARDWYRLRYVQRHLLMSSLSLSRRLLVLTGRFSVFRARLAAEPGFVTAIEVDSLQHWRHGTVRFLTGDDKSTWYWLLRQNRPMLYLPDVRIISAEVIPPGRFVEESLRRMRRWYGNMLRNNGRALALGPRRMPLFLWWCLADQRVSMWTSLSAPVFVLTAAACGKAALVPAYLLWVMVSRLVYAAALSLAAGGFSMRWPLLLYYNQMVGAAVKIVAGYSLDRQEWARQRVAAAGGRGAFWNGYITILAAGLFVYVGAAASAGLSPPDRLLLAAVFGGGAAAATPAADDIQARLDAGGLVSLPEGIIPLDRPLLVRRGNVRLVGAGVGKTVLLARFAGDDAAVIDVVGPSPQKVARRFCVRTADDAGALATRLAYVGGTLPARGHLWMGLPNDPQFLGALGAAAWRDEHPWLRQGLAAFSTAATNTLFLANPLGTALPANTILCPIGLLGGIEIRDLSIAFDLGGVPDPGDYRNLRPHHRIDGLRIRGAAAPVVADVSVKAAGRHSLHLDGVLAPQVARFAADGAWNKGPGGNGYLRIARTYHGRFSGIRLRGLRHLAIQWSSFGNRIDGLDSDTDVNFHGGFAHDNLVLATSLDVRAGHPWPAVYRTPADAEWAPPDGEGNVVIVSGAAP